MNYVFSVAVPALWNIIPLKIWMSPTLISLFKALNACLCCMFIIGKCFPRAVRMFLAELFLCLRFYVRITKVRNYFILFWTYFWKALLFGWAGDNWTPKTILLLFVFPFILTVLLNSFTWFSVHTWILLIYSTILYIYITFDPFE